MARLICEDGTEINISQQTEAELRKVFEKKKYKEGTLLQENDTGLMFRIIRTCNGRYALLNLHNYLITGKCTFLNSNDWPYSGKEGIELDKICNFPDTKSILGEK